MWHYNTLGTVVALITARQASPLYWKSPGYIGNYDPGPYVVSHLGMTNIDILFQANFFQPHLIGSWNTNRILSINCIWVNRVGLTSKSEVISTKPILPSRCIISSQFCPNSISIWPMPKCQIKTNQKKFGLCSTVLVSSGSIWVPRLSSGGTRKYKHIIFGINVKITNVQERILLKFPHHTPV